MTSETTQPILCLAPVGAVNGSKPLQGSPALMPVFSKPVQASFPSLSNAVAGGFQGFPNLSKLRQGISRKKRLFISMNQCSPLPDRIFNPPTHLHMENKTRKTLREIKKAGHYAGLFQHAQ
jgi:hypothetical protein